MKLNIANPATGLQKVIEMEDEKKLRIFYEKRMAQDVEVDALGDEFKGYVLRITGGQDKEGFTMKQGVLLNTRVRLLLPKGTTGFANHRGREGERKRRSVRGCIVGPDLAVLNLVVVKKGEGELPGLTDSVKPRRLGPKRASKIRKLFNLTKEDDVTRYVIRREIESKNPKVGKFTKAPKIQRLVTPIHLQRQRRKAALRKQAAEKSATEARTYKKLINARRAEQLAKKHHAVAAKRAEAPAAAPAKAAPKK
eukprot:TRINITY_DN40_c0_g1_i3.p2 TRINITY_DN40_c0_g1~~TRINITY_DN40_c0_g1_i3.p2  ORF type:complete len:272 (+),score=194.70 TRINITY_DN40_c0_g1_i3:63-818(+)